MFISNVIKKYILNCLCQILLISKVDAAIGEKKNPTRAGIKYDFFKKSVKLLESKFLLKNKTTTNISESNRQQQEILKRYLVILSELMRLIYFFKFLLFINKRTIK